VKDFTLTDSHLVRLSYGTFPPLSPSGPERNERRDKKSTALMRGRLPKPRFCVGQGEALTYPKEVGYVAAFPPDRL
jgi:hypothetical protein